MYEMYLHTFPKQHVTFLRLIGKLHKSQQKFTPKSRRERKGRALGEARSIQVGPGPRAPQPCLEVGCLEVGCLEAERTEGNTDILVYFTWHGHVGRSTPNALILTGIFRSSRSVDH